VANVVWPLQLAPPHNNNNSNSNNNDATAVDDTNSRIRIGSILIPDGSIMCDRKDATDSIIIIIILFRIILCSIILFRICAVDSPCGGGDQSE
jgi:hypothetical protein